MDRSFHDAKNQRKQCQKCKNGRLSNQVYFYHFGFIAREFCKCAKGKVAFNNWLKMPEVKRAYRTKREAKIKKALEVSQLPIRWQDQKIEDIENEDVRKKMKLYLADFSNHRKQGQGIYLHGESETERIRLLSILCLEVIRKYAQPCIFLKESQIIGKIQSSFNIPENDGGIFIKQLQDIPCLFIDSFASKIKQWQCEQIQNVIEYRYNKKLPTFLSSFFSVKKYEQAVRKVLPPDQQSLPRLVSQMSRDFEININS